MLTFGFFRLALPRPEGGCRGGRAEVGTPHAADKKGWVTAPVAKTWVRTTQGVK